MFNTDLGLQVANRKNVEDRARATHWREAREARAAARQRRRAASVHGQPTGAPVPGPGAHGWRWAAHHLVPRMHHAAG